MPVRTQKEAGTIGEGADRAIAFGGGGLWFIAWMLGYSQGLNSGGVDPHKTNVTIGTSAGAVVGAAVKAGTTDSFIAALHDLAADPETLQVGGQAPSQVRARNIQSETDEITPQRIQEIGRAAMAARNAPVADYISLVQRLLGLTEWPSGHYTTATDCYTGESVIVDQHSGVPIEVAGAASSSLPGSMGPTWVGDRLCMDGGVSTSSTHANTLRGAKFVLILGMFDFKANPPKQVNPSFGMAERINPGTAQREAEFLRSHGSTVHVAIANPDPTTNFLDPATISPAIAEGHGRGLADAALIESAWNSVG